MGHLFNVFGLLLISLQLGWGQRFELERSFQQHQQPVSYVAFRAEDNLLVSGDEGGEMIIWDSSNGTIVQRIDAHKGLITHIAFSPDAFMLASASYDGTVKIWSLKNFELLHTFQNSRADFYEDLTGAEPTFAAFTPDNKGVLFGGYNLEVLYGDFQDQSTQKVFQTEDFAITCGMISPDEQHLVIAYGSIIQYIRLKDFSLAKRIQLADELEHYICEIAFRPQKKIISAWLYDGRLMSWNENNQKAVQTLTATREEGTSNIAYSGDGEFLVTGNQGSHTKLWDVNEGKVIQVLEEHTAEVVTFDYSLDGTYIVTGSRDHVVNLWKKRQAIVDAEIPLPKKVKNRKTENQEIIYLENATIDLLFWDNRKIDGDIISVNLNGNWVIEEHTLAREPKAITVKFTQSKNYLTIHAHNEGDIKPNTIALTVRDGAREKTVTLRSDLKTSAAVSLVYKK